MVKFLKMVALTEGILCLETTDNNETNEGGDEEGCVFQFQVDSI